MIHIEPLAKEFSPSPYSHPQTNLFVYLDPVDWTVKSTVLQEHVDQWPVFTVYRARPLGRIGQVEEFLKSPQGQWELERVKEDAELEDLGAKHPMMQGAPRRWIQRTGKIHNVQTKTRRAAVDGVDYEPYLRGDLPCPDGHTKKQLWADLSDADSVRWYGIIHPEVAAV